MPYDDDPEALYEDLDDFGPESDDDGDSIEADLFGSVGSVLTGGLSTVAPSVGRRLFGRRPRTGKGRGYSSHIKGTRQGTIATRAGQAQFNLPKSVVTDQELKIALQKVAHDIKRNADAIRELDKKHEALILQQQGNINKKTEALKQQSMLSAFLQPQIKSFKTKSDSPTNPNSEFFVEKTTFDDNTLLLLAMMGAGGGSDSDSLIWLLALKDKF